MTNVAELRSIIGNDALNALVMWRPGKRIRVPKNSSVLAPVIGEVASRALSQALAHTHLWIPLPNRRVDQDKAWALLLEGRSPREIAARMGFTRNAIERIRAQKVKIIELGLANESLLTAREAAAYLGISMGQLNDLLIQEGLKCFSLGSRAHRYLAKDCEKLRQRLQ